MIDFYFFLVGSILASFLGLVIDRFPEQSIIQPASHCDSCQTSLRPLDLIPIFSQVLNRFRCRYCKEPYPVWYALFELGLGSQALRKFVSLVFENGDIDSISLNVFEANQAAKHLYQKEGFEIVKTIEAPVRKYVMKKFR